MCGPTQCGKTALIKDIIRDIDKVIKPTPDKLPGVPKKSTPV
jgi:stage III sporulation protein SpoIIIAA